MIIFCLRIHEYQSHPDHVDLNGIYQKIFKKKKIELEKQCKFRKWVESFVNIFFKSSHLSGIDIFAPNCRMWCIYVDFQTDII